GCVDYFCFVCAAAKSSSVDRGRFGHGRWIRACGLLHLARRLGTALGSNRSDLDRVAASESEFFVYEGEKSGVSILQLENVDNRPLRDFNDQHLRNFCGARAQGFWRRLVVSALAGSGRYFADVSGEPAGMAMAPEAAIRAVPVALAGTAGFCLRVFSRGRIWKFKTAVAVLDYHFRSARWSGRGDRQRRVVGQRRYSGGRHRYQNRSRIR